MKTPRVVIQAMAQIKTKLISNKADCDFKVYPCAKGGVETGNICTVFTWNGDNSIKHAALERKRIYSTDAKKVWRFYLKNIKPEIKRIDRYIRLLALYRESDLIPKRIAVKHRDKVVEQYGTGWRRIKDGLDYIESVSSAYIQRWSVCPKCGQRHGFTDTILGWNCLFCDATWENVDSRNSEWDM
jgi:hypothetical protein